MFAFLSEIEISFSKTNPELSFDFVVTLITPFELGAFLNIPGENLSLVSLSRSSL